MDSNLISINIVAYNAEKTLLNTLKSILNQQEVSYEIVFINDTSKDETLSIIQNFKEKNPTISCTIISNPQNLGIARSRNIALNNSKGEFIAVLDSDDTWANPNKLKQQLSFLLNNKDYGVVGTQMRIVNSEGEVLKTTQHKTTAQDIKNKMLILNQIGHSSILMRKTDLRYDESLYIWEDYDFFLRLGFTHKLANIDSAMIEYLYAPKKYSLLKKIKLTSTEIQIIKRYKKQYPYFWIGYCKGLIKYLLILLHLK